MCNLRFVANFCSKAFCAPPTTGSNQNRIDCVGNLFCWLLKHSATQTILRSIGSYGKLRSQSEFSAVFIWFAEVYMHYNMCHFSDLFSPPHLFTGVSAAHKTANCVGCTMYTYHSSAIQNETKKAYFQLYEMSTQCGRFTSCSKTSKWFVFGLFCWCNEYSI